MPASHPPARIAALGLLLAAACAPPDDSATVVQEATVVTFNTGTTEGLVPDDDPNGGYGSEQAGWSDAWYGDGLAFLAVMEDTRAWFESTQAQVVAFQEIFYSGDCGAIPEEYTPGFVCESWQQGDPTVAQWVLGDGWQVACHPGRNDKCGAVREDFGRFVGCDSDLCLEGLQGGEIDGCGSGTRVGRGTLELTDGGSLTLVSVHGSSGLSQEDQDCRKLQFQQVFEDLGDGEPAANGERNLIMGDMNTDPGRATEADESAAYLAQQVDGERFHFVTEAGADAEPSYAGIFNIDHVISDHLDGDCSIAGLTEDDPPVSEIVFFDHKAVACSVGPF